ncbi:hypothetical protein TNCV_342131 [Trichonephila clavipes]|nr:hypothetical protein TNCV_342131 [Trichonephila clavipes]
MDRSGLIKLSIQSVYNAKSYNKIPNINRLSGSDEPAYLLVYTREGRESVKDDERSGRPQTSHTVESIEKVSTACPRYTRDGSGRYVSPARALLVKNCEGVNKEINSVGSISISSTEEHH